MTQSERKKLMGQLDVITREIVFWRDGQQCVQRVNSFGRCGGHMTWGHFIPQGESGWLCHDLGNSACQCQGHNKLHHHHERHMINWYIATFGQDTYRAIDAEHKAHIGAVGKRTIPELRDMLAAYDELYCNRPSVWGDMMELIQLGYYGEIVRANCKLVNL